MIAIQFTMMIHLRGSQKRKKFQVQGNNSTLSPIDLFTVMCLVTAGAHFLKVAETFQARKTIFVKLPTVCFGKLIF